MDISPMEMEENPGVMKAINLLMNSGMQKVNGILHGIILKPLNPL